MHAFVFCSRCCMEPFAYCLCVALWVDLVPLFFLYLGTEFCHKKLVAMLFFWFCTTSLSATALARRRARVVPNMLGLGLGLGFGFVLKNLDLGGRTIHPRPCRRRGSPPQNLPKPMKNHCFALWSLLERPQSVLEPPKTI